MAAVGFRRRESLPAPHVVPVFPEVLMRRIVPCLFLALALPSWPLAAGSVTLSPVADATIFEENGDAADAKGPSIFAGRNNLTFIRRSLLRFDVGGAVPAGSTITSARLELTLTRANGNPVDVSLFAAAAAWTQGTSNAGNPGGSGTGATAGDATWTKRTWPATSWATPGGDTAGSPSATSPIAATLGVYTWGPTSAMASDVQGWLDNPGTNFGWQLRADELQAAPSARRFGSLESANPAEAPLLTITFTPLSGPPPASAADVPALSPRALAALAAALAVLGAMALKR
jgi:hypothetical protein